MEAFDASNGQYQMPLNVSVGFSVVKLNIILYEGPGATLSDRSVPFLLPKEMSFGSTMQYGR